MPVVTLLGALRNAIATHSKGRLHRHPMWRRLHVGIVYMSSNYLRQFIHGNGMNFAANHRNCKPTVLWGTELVQALEAHLDVQVVCAVPRCVRLVMHPVPLTCSVKHWGHDSDHMQAAAPAGTS